MKRKLIISENHIMKLILDEVNENSLGVEFMLSNWQVSEKNDGTLLIQRRHFENGRFDKVETFDDQTYSISEKTITPMGINSLNGSYLTHPDIQEINYSPELMFLVNADDEAIVSSNIIALEEVRARLMQYQKVFKISQYNLNDGSVREEQVVKAVLTAGEITYGSVERINGIGYLLITMSLDIFATNKGEFSNQEKFLFGTSAILGPDGKPKMFEIPLITWHYAMALDTDPTQLLMKNATNNEKASEVVNYAVGKAFGIVFVVQIDFNDEFLRHIYLDGRQRKAEVPIYYIESWTEYYDQNLELKELDGSRYKRTFYLDGNGSTEPLSLGDKLEYTLSFSVSNESWFE